ncbi:hypothetical protein BDV06DRAFT_231294 [Aspergillus oleicola]
MNDFKVYVRWRPLAQTESPLEINQSNEKHDTNYSITLSNPSAKEWKSGPSFSQVFNAIDNNKRVFQDVVKPCIPRILGGKICNFFAYGHSGSGKSHTVIGYNYEQPDEFGLCLAAAHRLFDEMHQLNAQNTSDTDKLGLGIRMFELRGKTALDLLNNCTECHVREGPDGRTYIRGETEMLAKGKVRVRPIATKACWSFDDLKSELLIGLKMRATGSSSVHDQSSRTHAVVELEIVTKALLDARDSVIERQSELVPVGKCATDIYIEEWSKAVTTVDGKVVPDHNYQVNQTRIDEAEALKAEFEARVREAEDQVVAVAKSCPHTCLGGKLVFVDLAGSEYYHDKATGTTQLSRPKQTPQEQREGRQINTDLLALKEVIRAKASNQSRIPFRSSPLTMVLREHFVDSSSSSGGDAGHSAVILTVSPTEEKYAATMNTLKYGNLMGAAGRK